METNQNQAKTQNITRVQSTFAEPRAFLSKDGEYLMLVLPGNIVVRKHVNFYKAVLGVEFTPKAKLSNAS